MKAGVMLIDKATGMSSAAVVARLKKKLSLDRVGHAGTLDPMASGLLVCLSGAATRLAAYAQGGIKIYSGLIQLGVTTSTDDSAGDVLSRSESLPSFDAVKQHIPSFSGLISQVPPRISAVKVNGERSYRRARRGEDFELSARTVEVFAFDITPTEQPDLISYRVRCSKGTYIRSLARDLGDRLGCGACISTLRREGTEPFSIEAAKPLDEFTEADVLPWDALFPGISEVQVSEAEARKLLNGERRALESIAARLPRQDVPLAVYRTDRPLGLLCNQGASWDFAINVG